MSLDPCPVCGSEMEHDPNHDILVCVVCIYSAPPSNHRRLCAEVALARVVMEIDETGGLSAGYTTRQQNALQDAITRVRGPSK